jgi:hypothetical protein
MKTYHDIIGDGDHLEQVAEQCAYYGRAAGVVIL